ncbi:MAG: AAA family ATPase [Myxococcota bacterium]
MYERGLVVGKFAPLHQGHQLLIETALAQCRTLYLWTYANPDFPTMPTDVRMGWLRTLYPQAHLLPEGAGSPPNGSPDTVHQDYAQAQLERWGIDVEVLFTSEHYGASFAERLGAEHRLVDLDRARVPISGTQMRRDIHGQRQWLHPVVYGHFVERVVILGAESTGKSTLTARLAAEYNTHHVDEFGRELYEQLDGQLEPHHFDEIARGHREREDRARVRPGACRYLFCDTNAMTTAAFAFMMTGQASPSLLRFADACKARYAHVFVCAADIPFDQDGWRASEAVRSVHQGLLLYELHVRGIAYTMLHGDLEERVRQVRTVLDS